MRAHQYKYGESVEDAVVKLKYGMYYIKKSFTMLGFLHHGAHTESYCWSRTRQ